MSCRVWSHNSGELTEVFSRRWGWGWIWIRFGGGRGNDIDIFKSDYGFVVNVVVVVAVLAVDGATLATSAMTENLFLY